MSDEAREALRVLHEALDEHLGALLSRRGETDTRVDDAYDTLAEAFERYEEALDVSYGETMPVVLEDSDDDDVEDLGDIDPHAEEDEDGLDDDLDEFDLR